MTQAGTELGGVIVGVYDLRLVTLSVLISILAAYAALDLAGRVTAATGKARFFWLSGGAIAMGVGIWSMHYIGMLALKLPVTVSYDWPTVLLSLLAAIAASRVALFVVSREEVGAPSIVLGSVVMGSGIAGMHYIGMEAMRLPAMCHYSPRLVVLSVVLAIVIAGVALYLTLKLRKDTADWGWKKGLTALVMGAAIPIMHYVGMSAATFTSMPLDPTRLRNAVRVSSLELVVITLVTLLLLVIVFVTALVDRHFTLKDLEIRSGEQRYRLVIESAFSAFLMFDSTLRILDWNAHAAKIFGWMRNDAKGRPLDDFILLDRPNEETKLTLRDLLKCDETTGMRARLEVIARHRDGSEFPAEMTISSIESGRRVLFIAFVLDVAARKQMELEREAARKMAEDASRAKGEFLANMSHEIRTPLNGVIGMTELTLETELTQEQREYLETVRLSAESLLSVINDILDFSKIEAGRMDLEEVDFDLRECMENALRTLALRADEKGLELLCDVDANVPNVLRGDPHRLRQIVTNLLGNALKFTNKGEVALMAETDSVVGDLYALHFVVSDTGIGIAPDKLESVFESFSQADTSTTRLYGGTGLGLTISRRLVEMMGGSIHAESELGKGSEFHFTVQLKRGKEHAPAAELGHGTGKVLEGVSVLVVDDNRTNRRILEGILKNWGMKPTLACNGQSAMEALEQALQEGTPFQLILTDMNMPAMDGLELIENIRRRDKSVLATIMMLTSSGHRGDATRCEELGIAAYLLKPIRQADLREAMARVLGAVSDHHETSLVTQNTLERDRAHAALNVLLAEDNLVNQKLARTLLEKRGHRVTVVATGSEALQALEQARFDIVLMDVQMPEMDGIEATKAIRAREQEAGGHQTIIAMTALAMKGDHERVMEAGMDEYLTKPIRAHELDEVLDKYSASESRANVLAGHIPHDSVNFERDVINTNELMERIGNDLGFLAELVTVFREDHPAQLMQIANGLAMNVPDEVRRSAHLLRGTLANLSAPAAAALAVRLEEEGTSGDLSQSEATFAAFKIELDRALDALNTLTQQAAQ
jgi:two-component system, sensor histidine kinase and response regulator